MYWLKTEFLPYCKRKGIQILKDDIKYIEKVLSSLPKEAHKIVLRDYVKIWLDSMGDDSKSSLNQNLGRKNANIYLRELLDDRKG